MKSKVILLFVVLISIIYIICIRINNKIIKKYINSDILKTIATDTGYVIQYKNFKYESSKIDLYFPLTKYKIINKEINEFILTEIENFKNEIKKIDRKKEYIYNLNFDYYETGTHITIVFHSFINLKIAHPIIYVKTINYNKNTNKIETINDYVKKDNKFINKIKKSVYDDLIKNNIYKDESLKKYLVEALNSGINIYEDYIVTEEGLTFIFEPYKVAPYVYGEIQSAIKIKDKLE